MLDAGFILESFPPSTIPALLRATHLHELSVGNALHIDDTRKGVLASTACDARRQEGSSQLRIQEP